MDRGALKEPAALFIAVLGLQAVLAGSVLTRDSAPKISNFCTTNGEDGFSEAPSGTAQFVSLLNSYRIRPSWCVAGVDYAVGIRPNATAKGNTITETEAIVAPTNSDQKSFYPRAGGSLPSGITQGAPYYVCNVVGSSGSYSFSLSTSRDCSSAVQLGELETSFISLKLPEATVNKPSGVTGWDWSKACEYNGQTTTICVIANNVTLDHWDFSTKGGWWILLGAVSNPTITNNYMLVGSNIWPVMQDLGSSPTNVTFNNNQVDGNAIALYSTAAGTFSAGTTAIAVSSEYGIALNMTITDTTSPSALQSGTLVVSTIGKTVYLSKPLAETVRSGDTIGFVRAPAPGTSMYGVPQISFSGKGTTVVRYNWIRNTCSEHWQQSLPPTGGFTSAGISFDYNVFENTGWCGRVTGAHGDVVQIYCGNPNNDPAADCMFKTISLNYNTIIQDNPEASAGSTTFSLLFSGAYGGTAVTTNVNNNTAIYPVTGVNTSTYGLAAINPSWVLNEVNIQNNYVDPTSACAGPGKCGGAYWSNIFKGNGGGAGLNSAACRAGGNVNLVTGALLPKPIGGRC